MTDHGAIMDGIGDAALEAAFGAEWINLESGRSEVLADFMAGCVDGGFSASEYKRRIGAGNLARYADMCVAVAKRGNQAF